MQTPQLPRQIFRHAAPPNFFYGSAESQPNFSNVPASRILFGANIQRSLNETDYIKSSHFS